MSFPDPKYYSFGSTRTKAEAAADRASAEVRRLQRINADPKEISAAIERRNKAWNNVRRLRER